MNRALYEKFIYLWHLLSWFALYIPLRTLFRFNGVRPRDQDITAKPLLIVANHKSLYDPWFFTHTLNFKQFSMSAPMKAMATQKFSSSFLNLIYHIIIKPFIYFPYGVVTLMKPKDNGNGLSINQKIAPFESVLNDSGSIFMFPEGGLHRMPMVRNFKRGAGCLQKNTGAPILLVSIRFSKRDWFPGTAWWLPWTRRTINWDQKLTYIPRQIINDEVRSAEYLKEEVLQLYRNGVTQ